ncbi:MAG: diguanylate cyclase [Campylobacterota bacterium]|nr:diguanylate cyclase [Campylobacterota bacterium]
MPSLKLLDIATLDVVSIDEEKSINEAIALMNKQNHREIIITSHDKKIYGLLRANDLIKLRIAQVDFDIALKSIKYDKVVTVDQGCTIEYALQEIDPDCQCLCVLDNNRDLKGFISYFDILSCMDPQMMLEKRTISEVMLQGHLKRTQVDTSTLEVISMLDNSISESIVVYDQSEAVGILTTKDIIKLFGEKKDLNLPIKHYMSSPLLRVKHDITINNALKFIQEKHFKRVIVEDYSGDILGQITQEELIAKVYSRWAEAMKQNDQQLQEVNKVLSQRAQKFQELSSTDTLTSISNRGRFEEDLTFKIDEIKRYAMETFSIVFFDIDNFKQINDTYGHLKGDEVLKDLASFVQENLRTSDKFARWGGEEFVIILPHTPKDNAMLMANTLLSKMHNEVFANDLKLTCSFGVTSFDKDTDTQQTLLTRADHAMYQAKIQGKNQVIVA